MIDWADVTAIAPSLTTVPVASQDALLAQVLIELDESAWGAGIELGRAWLAAHLGTLYQRGSSSSPAAGAVTSESVGDVSRSYAAPAAGSDVLSSTPYGQEFVRLRDSFVVARLGAVL